MCLLNVVVAWDDRRIECRTATHRDLANPLRRGDRLDAVCALEYGAQAAAVHGGLMSGEPRKPVRGYLAAARALTWSVDRLDTIDGNLDVACERLLGEHDRVIYGFVLRAAGRTLASGRLAVVLLLEPA